MAGFIEIVVIAFGAQLAVLPGEKVQFIIAGLSTRFHPLLVVSAAGTAFALWTTVEILAGEALQRVLPGWALAAVSGLLFLAFAVMLYRSAPAADEEGTMPGTASTRTEGDAASAPTGDADTPAAETDGGIAAASETVELDATLFGREVPNYLGGFVPIFSMMAVGEFGDKTQLVTIGLAATYGATPAIWVGEMLAIIPISLANAYFFHHFSHRFDLRRAHLVSALLFAFFGLDTFLGLTTGVSVWETAVETVSGL